MRGVVGWGSRSAGRFFVDDRVAGSTQEVEKTGVDRKHSMLLCDHVAGSSRGRDRAKSTCLAVAEGRVERKLCW